MSKRGWLAFMVGLLLVIGILATPFILRAIPPRYLARLPQPLQEIGAPPDPTPILPTVAVTADLSLLLQPAQQPTITPTFAPPPTFTPPAVAGVNTILPTLPATFTPQPTPTPTNTPIPRPSSARLEGIYHQFQDWNNCGPTTLAMTMSYFGMALTQSDAAAVMKPNPEDRNVSPSEMAAYVNNETEYQAITRVNGSLETIRQFVANGIPVILEIGIDPPGEYAWMGWYGHYLLVVAYDDAQQQLWVYDSWLGTSDVPGQNADRNGRILSYTDLNTYWPQFNRNYIAVYRPEQAELVATIVGPEVDDAIMWQNALTAVQTETAASPNNAFLWFNLGTVYNALGRYQEAASAFDQSRAIGLPWRMLWYQFGPYEAYYQIARYQDVILLADVTLQDRPYFEESFYYKGLAEAALGNQETALADLQSAADFNPNFAPAIAALQQFNNQ